MGFSSFRKNGSEIHIHMDLVMDEILTRLQAESLMRFKCVSKLWSYHITSQHFSNRFLTVPSRPRPRVYMCLSDFRHYDEPVILSAAPGTQSSFVVDHVLTIPMRTFNTQNIGGFMYGHNRIFNPATRQLVTLPSTDIPPPGEGRNYASYYFGHDPVNDQYKMLYSTFSINLENIRSEHWVFVLKPGGGSWKKLTPTPPDFRPHVPCPTTRLCMDGVLYYVALIGKFNCVLVSFHIRSEEFKNTQIPRKVIDDLPSMYKNISLIDYGGKVTIVTQNSLRDKGMLDLWVLEDATNKGWSRKSLVMQPSQLHLVNNTAFYVRGTTQNGNVLLIPEALMSPFHILCYDLQRKYMRKIEIMGIPDHWFSKDKGNVRLDLMFMDQSECYTLGDLNKSFLSLMYAFCVSSLQFEGHSWSKQ